jgi:hypothetical protein
MLLLSHILVKLALGKSMANVDEHEEHEYAGGNRDPHVAGHFSATDQRGGGVDTSRVVAATVDCREVHSESCWRVTMIGMICSLDFVGGTAGTLCRSDFVMVMRRVGRP